MSFSGHETFPLRYAWLTKGLRAAIRRTDAFKRAEALTELGVGKNMVSAIRHYAQATNVITSGDKPTDLGLKLLGENGWDPYLEDIGTLWLIHWQLVSNPVKASTWDLAFYPLGQRQFY